MTMANKWILVLLAIALGCCLGAPLFIKPMFFAAIPPEALKKRPNFNRPANVPVKFCTQDEIFAIIADHPKDAAQALAEFDLQLTAKVDSVEDFTLTFKKGRMEIAVKFPKTKLNVKSSQTVLLRAQFAGIEEQPGLNGAERLTTALYKGLALEIR